MKNKAINALIEMGADAGNKGFEYIVDAMTLFENDEIRTGKTMLLYSKIAEMHNTSWENVERCIRHSFKTILTRGKLNTVEKYLSTQKTTNGNLLHVFYIRLTQEE